MLQHHQPPHFQPIPQEFYARPHVETIALELLGKYLFSNISGVVAGGMIVETEAYSGHNDAASHSSQGRRTKRTEVMFGPPGVAYVYLIYGIYSLFNVVTNVEGAADAVLIRALEPAEGVEEMKLRRSLTKVEPRLTAGPGLLTQALGINTAHTGLPLAGPHIWLEDHQLQIPEESIVAGPRVGVAYAGADALLPRRFSLRDNKWVSKANPKY
ncbi:DNA-3-methyladenine glycosylase [Rufibacter roseus]|uniref:Putative 3-methyladenine DNA glycosylase n=1 Tax=Rufibacter roseus TaxID=1567108 RepID=A0ABW2DNV9_9BACT|nr:DNA-3-methyladenine glycosylase [Rufibacter roseus]